MAALRPLAARALCLVASALALACEPQAVRSEPPVKPQLQPSAAASGPEGELAHDDELVTAPGEAAARRADRYTATWAQDGAVRVFLVAPAEAQLRLLARGHLIEAPAELQVSAGRPVALVVLGASATAEGPYRLLFEPPPAELVAPPRNTPEGRKERALGWPPQPGFYGTAASRKQAVAAELAGYAQDGKPLSTLLEQFAGFETPADPEHCFKLVLRLQEKDEKKDREGASWSDLARRALRASVLVPGAGALKEPVVKVLGPTLITSEACPDASGPLTFAIGTFVEGSENDLGHGPAAVEVWTKPHGPLARTAADLEREAAKATRGYTAQKAQAVQLEALAPLELEVPRGRCVAAVLRLQKGARFSPEVRRARLLSAALEGADAAQAGLGPGLVGPGAVHLLGCARGAAKARVVHAQGQPVGSGPATLQLFFRNASASELR